MKYIHTESFCLMDTARLVATVDLPTPPLPEKITITFLTPAIGIFLGKPRAA